MSNKMTDELRAKIDAAMNEGGTKANAAILLGMTSAHLCNIMRKDALLTERWTKTRSKYGGKVRSMDDSADREAPDMGRSVAIPDSDMRDAEALAREDANLQRGVESMGLSAQAGERAVALQKFYKKHFTDSIGIVGAGSIKSYFELDADVEKIRDELEGGGLTIEREQMLRRDRVALLELQGRSGDRHVKAQMTQAMIKYRIADSSGEKAKSRGKPGFTPIVNAIKIEADGNINLSGQHSTD